MSLIKKIKETKGMTGIDYIISFLVFILIFSFCFDMFFIGYKQYQVSKVASTIVRDITTQSGIKNTVPNNYPGGDGNYVRTDEAYRFIEKQMSNLGITNWSVQISMKDRNTSASSEKTFILTNNSSGYNTDYRGEISITINYTYKWGLWSQLVPGTLNGSRSITRTGYGEYKHDYNNWKGEQ